MGAWCVKFVGSCHLTPNTVVKRVLFILDFKFSLLFVSKLAFENNFSVKFLSHSYMVQDLHIDTVLAIGK